MTHKENSIVSPELQKLISDPLELLSDVFEQLDALKIDANNFLLDHIGYRAASTQEYEEIKTALMKNGVAQLVSEDEVRGRRISVFTLYRPVQYSGRAIDGLEVIEPKLGDNRMFPHKLEHAEFVITDMSLEEFVEKNPQVIFDERDMRRADNPEIRLKLDSGRTAGFHTIALVEYVKK